MKTKLTLAFFMLALICQLQADAQRACSSFSYQQQQLQQDPSLASRLYEIESFTRQYLQNNSSDQARVTQGSVIKIPVVVHILYHYSNENIDDAKVHSQLAILNKSFRRLNEDTALTPSYFGPLAADCEIEFELAISDPQRKNTSGIIRKYTPLTDWEANDEMKFSATMGSDAWDSKNYLNIWVCNLQRVAGYATLPGGDPAKDGIVISFNAFGTNGAAGLDRGKTAVHEAGHWLNLRHLWGDDYCGDDGVSDTPKQGGYNSGCPSGNHITCNNGPYGDMYMNYMDFTNDACVNLFTRGQKARMNALFITGGARHSLLSSTGLLPPLIYEIPLPEESPRWLHPQLYPNPANDEVTLDLSYDVRWVGKTVNIINVQGQVVMQVQVSSKIQTIITRALKPGMYILFAKKEGGDFIKQQFIKL